MQSNLFRWLAYPALAAVCLFAGCVDPRLPPRPVGKAPGAPPGPPAAPAPPGPGGAGVISAPAPESAAPGASGATHASGLPADLVTKIDTLIQHHKDYIAAAEKVQDPQAARDNVKAMRERTETSSALFEDIMIASGKLSAPQQSAFEAYMNAHVTAISTQARDHAYRMDKLLDQAP